MHVVLFGAIVEVVDPGHHRVIGPGDVDPIVDDVAGMRHPLAADHELVFGLVAERVGDAAVIAAEADAALDRGGEVRQLLLVDLRHGQDRHDQAEVAGAPGRRRPRSPARQRPRSLPPRASPRRARRTASGSWPAQPPQAMSASASMLLPLRPAGPAARPRPAAAGARGRVAIATMRRGLGGGAEGLHHLQHMQRQCARGPVRPAAARIAAAMSASPSERSCRRPRAARPARGCQSPPLASSRPAAEAVRVGDEQAPSVPYISSGGWRWPATSKLVVELHHGAVAERQACRRHGSAPRP